MSAGQGGARPRRRRRRWRSTARGRPRLGLLRRRVLAGAASSGSPGPSSRRHGLQSFLQLVSGAKHRLRRTKELRKKQSELNVASKTEEITRSPPASSTRRRRSASTRCSRSCVSCGRTPPSRRRARRRGGAAARRWRTSTPPPSRPAHAARGEAGEGEGEGEEGERVAVVHNTALHTEIAQASISKVIVVRARALVPHHAQPAAGSHRAHSTNNGHRRRVLRPRRWSSAAAGACLEESGRPACVRQSAGLRRAAFPFDPSLPDGRGARGDVHAPRRRKPPMLRRRRPSLPPPPRLRPPPVVPAPASAAAAMLLARSDGSFLGELTENNRRTRTTR